MWYHKTRKGKKKSLLLNGMRVIKLRSLEPSWSIGTTFVGRSKFSHSVQMNGLFLMMTHLIFSRFSCFFFLNRENLMSQKRKITYLLEELQRHSLSWQKLNVSKYCPSEIANLSCLENFMKWGKTTIGIYKGSCTSR